MDSKEFRVLVHDCFLMGKNTVQTKQWLDKCYGDSAPGKLTVAIWFAEFKCGQTDTNNAERSGRPNEALDSKIPQYWLFKVEPSDFPIAKLKADGIVTWDGVKNFQAQKYMKIMKTGDLALYYHTEKERSIVGIARISKEYYIDKDPKFGVVDVEYVESFANPVTLDTIKKTEKLEAMTILKQPRLSISSVTSEQWDIIKELSHSK